VPVELWPALLPRSLPHLRQLLARLHWHDHVHLDVVGPPYGRSNLQPDQLKHLRGLRHVSLHLMVRRPEDFFPLPKWVHQVIVHREATQVWTRLAKKRGRAELLFALGPRDRLSELSRLHPRPRTIVVMGVQPGAQGQPPAANTLARVRRLTAEGYACMVDGSASLTRLPSLYAAGARGFVEGSRLVQAKNPEAAEALFRVQLHALASIHGA
jgi:pentose-5-phosphate-3-epimerase